MEKRCNICKKTLALDDFHKDKNTPDGHTYRCKSCNSNYAKIMRERHSAHGVVVTEKLCHRCGETRPASEFYKCPGNTSGLRPYCIPCSKREMIEGRDAHRERQRRRRQLYPELSKAQSRIKHLRLKFGLTPEQYELMLASQDGKCAICGKQQDKAFCVDHDHETNNVRGLLCDACNTGIGLFFDDPDLLRQAIGYLEIHQKK